jgi:O-antigen/teichoic acid export membrane protein
MIKKRDSVAKGGSTVAIARMIGMVFSFLLFIMLARHSAEHAGTFKTVMTYIIIAESFGMLGLQRWLAIEIATIKKARWALFWATNVFTLCVSIILLMIYIGISQSTIYTIEINDGLLLGALAVIPSGVYACVQTALLGIGKSSYLGKLNMSENIIRCVIAIGLVLLEQSVYLIILVFVATRWLVACYGFYYLKTLLNGHSWFIDPAYIASIKKAVPKFAMIVFSFLVLRNAGLLVIPALHTVTEAATFAVSYQLFDLILILPSVLALTTINLFSNKADSSIAGLKKTAIQLSSIIALMMFPLIAITCVFASNFIVFLYGSQYANGEMTLILLMLAAGFSTIDMVLSQIMQARKDYYHDMVSVVFAGATALIFTFILVLHYGAKGAAFALMIANVVNIAIRLRYLKPIYQFNLLILSIWKPLLASLLIYVSSQMLLETVDFKWIVDSKYLWMLCIPLLLTLYVFLIFILGSLKSSHRNRIHHFLFKH